ncbi:MAG TPA: S-adenosylmethionine:tRNA ribosyltransferase-isomerase [Acidimicrobiales bacterium]
MPERIEERVHRPTTDPARVPMDAYDYGLPESAIAQRPVEPRSAARLLVGPGLDGNESPEHATMAELPRLLRPGDVVVVNDTRVLPARLLLRKESGGRAEVLLLEPIDPDAGDWEALVRPGRRLPDPTPLYEPDARGGPVVAVGPVVGSGTDGRRRVRLLDPSVVERSGSMPLPPYIRRPLDDPERYQTVYSEPGALEDRSTAAPTAGLHFTPELLEACRAAGATVARVELAIGLDTFRPITAPTPAEHVIHSERYSVPPETMEACAAADRVVAVGTTAVRALESAAAGGGLAGRTDLYIHGEYPFRVVDVLVTNFHLPRSSLLLLVESFCGPLWRRLYATALADGYRFLSFGDAMVVARSGAGPSKAAAPGR